CAEEHIDPHQSHEKVSFQQLRLRELIPRIYEVENREQNASDDDVHGRPSQRDPQFITRIFRETFQSCDAANGQQRDVSRADAVMFRSQGMPELMQQHTSKKRDDESDATPRLGPFGFESGAEAAFHNLALRSRSALPMTETELKLIAAPAMMGLSSTPKSGYNTPAATGTPSAL